MIVNRFINFVDKEIPEDTLENNIDGEKNEFNAENLNQEIVSGPTSDQEEYDGEVEHYEDSDGLETELDKDFVDSSIEDEEDYHEEKENTKKEVITIKEKITTVTSSNKEKKQTLKNEKQRLDYIRNIENYNLFYDFKEVNARIYQMKEIPCIYEIQFFGKFYYKDEPSWKHAEYHFLNPKSTKEFGYCMFKSTSCSISVLVDYLKIIKF